MSQELILTYSDYLARVNNRQAFVKIGVKRTIGSLKQNFNLFVLYSDSRDIDNFKIDKKIKCLSSFDTYE